MLNGQKTLELLLTRKTSDTVFILGGGPSLMKNFGSIAEAKETLNKYNTIAVNNSYALVDNAICVFFMDKQWYTWNEEELKKLSYPVVTCSTDSCVPFYKNGKHVIGAFRRSGDVGLSKTPDYLHGTNSGHQAINIAALMGYKNIVLLGFDMDASSPQTHWHKGHKQQTRVDRYQSVMIPCMSTVDEVASQMGCKIWNTNKESKITYFEFCNLKERLDDAISYHL